jgi:hypothetical protein
MEKNEFARASVASWSRQIQRTKNDEQHQNTKLLSILQEKRKVETPSFHIMCYVDYNQNLKNAGRFKKAQRKK